MQKTLLLCFIHGFKGDDGTFGKFPEALRSLVQNKLHSLRVVSAVYPQYETRGELGECVGRFRDWLQNQVIDLEVEAGTPSPTVDPSVHTILIGHSMGGIVAAETLIAICSEKHIGDSETSDTTALMFPYISGVLAFDTPYLGIAPGVFAHGVEGNYNLASNTIAQASALYTGIWGAKTATSGFGDKSTTGKATSSDVLALEPPPPLDTASPSTDAAAAPTWQKWGKVAMFAGAAGAVAAGGAAAYMKRQQLSDGWSWAGSHLEFVGCLMRGEDLKTRVNKVVTLNREYGIGWANMYTQLGAEAAKATQKLRAGKLLGIGEERTFCNLPKSDVRKFFLPVVNDKATQETGAHVSMFFPKDNPGYYALCEKSRGMIVDWVDGDWAQSSERDDARGKGDIDVGP